ncbi:hypothetical protein CRYUN_Cryun36dG0034700 [Craigia yunnanensis]
MAMKMKRIAIISPSFPPCTGNSFLFSVSQLPRICFFSYYSISAVTGNENVNMGMSKPTHLENLVIHKCKSGSLKLDEALGFFNSMVSVRPLPSIWAFNHLLGALSKMKHYSTVVSLSRQMMTCSEIQPDIFTITTLMNCLCNLKKGT